MADFITPDVPLITPDAPIGGATPDLGAITPDAPVSADPPGFGGAILHGLISGIVQAGESLGKTGQAIAGKAPTAQAPAALQESPAYKELAKPLVWSDILHPTKLAYHFSQMLSEQAPAVAGAVLGGAAGTAAVGGPEDPLALATAPAGAAGGYGLVSAFQSFGPYYAGELQKTPQDPGGAYDRALKLAAANGAISTASAAAFGWAPFKSKLVNLGFQATAVQPAVGIAGAEAEKRLTSGQDITPEEAGSTYLQSLVGTAPLLAAHTLMGGARPAGGSPGSPEGPGAPPAPITPDAGARPPQAAIVPPAALAPDAVVGIRGPGGQPVRATIDAVQDGIVHWRDQDNTRHMDDLGAFQKDIVPAPPGPTPPTGAPLGPEPPPHPGYGQQVPTEDLPFTFEPAQTPPAPTAYRPAAPQPQPSLPTPTLTPRPSEAVAASGPAQREAPVIAPPSLGSPPAPEMRAPTDPTFESAARKISAAAVLAPPEAVRAWGQEPGKVPNFATDLTPAERASWEQGAPAEAPKAATKATTARAITPAGVPAIPAEPPTLLQFLAHDGVKDEGGEMSTLGADSWHAGKPFQRRLVRDNGLEIDQARLRAQEAGYPVGDDNQSFLDAVHDEMRGQKVYSAADEPAVAERRAALGVDPSREDDLRGREEDNLRADLASLGEQNIYGLDYGALRDRLDERLATMGADTPDHARAILAQENTEADRRLAAEPELSPLIGEEGGPHGPEGPAFGAAAPPAGGATERPAETPQAAVAPGPGSSGPGVEAPGAREPGGGKPAAVEQTQAGPQLVLPGAERSAVQAQAARDQQRGLTSSKEQQAPGGLFAEKPPTEAELFPGAEQSAPKTVDAPAVAAGINRVKSVLGDLARNEDGTVPRTNQLAEAARGVSNRTPSDPLRIDTWRPGQLVTMLRAGIESRDRVSADYGRALDAKQAAQHSLEADGAAKVQPYLKLSDADQTAINKVAEWDRMTNTDRQDTGRPVVLQADPSAFGDRVWPLRLTKPGETVRLTPEQSRVLFQTKDFLNDRFAQVAEGFARRTGYTGPFLAKDATGRLQFDTAGIQNAIDTASDRGLRGAAERAMMTAQEAEATRRSGYWPLNRYGDYFVKVTPKVPSELGGMPELARGSYSFVDSRGPLETITGGGKTSYAGGAPRRVLQAVAELKQKYPEAQFHYEIGKVGPRTFDSVDLPMVEKLLTAATFKDPKMAAEVYESVLKQVYEDQRAGFRRQANQIPGYCIVPETKILTADFRWAEAHILRVGDELVGFDAENREKHRRRMALAVVERIELIRKPCYRIITRLGREITVSDNHLLLGARGPWRRQTSWVAAAMIAVGMELKMFPVEEARTDFEAGWLSGILDGEGWMVRHNQKRNGGMRLGWAQVAGLVLERSKRIAEDAGLPLYKSATPNNGRAFNVGMSPWDATRALQLFRPIRLIAERKWIEAPLPTSRERDSVAFCQYVGERDVLAIKTSTHTFIANGFCSHNSSDFARSLSDYVRQSSAVVSSALHQNGIDAAYEATQQHPDAQVRKYWEGFQKRQQGSGLAVNLAQRFGFFNYLWGTVGSPIVQGFHTPIITASQLGAITNPIRGHLMADGAMAEVMRHVTVNSKGVTLPIERLGNTPNERQFLAKINREGMLEPGFTRQLAGGPIIKSAEMRKTFAPLIKVYDLGLSAFNTVVTANRAAAALAYYRAGHLPGVLDRAAKVYSKDASFPSTGGQPLTPEALARWGVRETQFRSGAGSEAPIMSGPAGKMATQFQHFDVNAMRILYKNLARMGPEGKVAGSMMLMGLMGVAGVTGLPFVKNAEQLGTYIYKQITGIDPLLERRFREYIADSGFAKLAQHYMGWDPKLTAEVATEGPSKALFGVDMGTRIGVGQMLPGNTDIVSSIPILDATLGRWQEYNARMASGQPRGAAAALMPSAIANPYRAFGVWPQEGYSTRTGTMVVPPSQITPGEQIARSLGMQPAAISRQGTNLFQTEELKYNTKQAASDHLTDVARQLSLAVDAQKSGRPGDAMNYNRQAEGLMRQYAQEFSDPTLAAWEKIPLPTRGQIQSRVRFYLNPMASLLKGMPTLKKPEAAASPFYTGQ